MKQIIFKFVYRSHLNGKFTVDVLATSDSILKIFGINLRFFYDAKIFKPANPDTLKILLPEGYRQYNFAFGNTSNGWTAFGSTGALTYVNGAVELTNPNKAIVVDGGWCNVLSIQLDSISPLTGTIYPSFIFDKKPDQAKGGYVGQSDEGVVCTEYIGTDSTSTMRTAPLLENVLHMNWSPNPTAVLYPWGAQNQNNGVNV